MKTSCEVTEDTHPAEPGHSQCDGGFEVIRTLLGQSGNKAGGCCYYSLKTDGHTFIQKTQTQYFIILGSCVSGASKWALRQWWGRGNETEAVYQIDILILHSMYYILLRTIVIVYC